MFIDVIVQEFALNYVINACIIGCANLQHKLLVIHSALVLLTGIWIVIYYPFIIYTG